MSAIGFEVQQGALQFADGTLAFESLDLRLDPGKLTVLLGPSGCGKTTFLRAVGGLLPLSDGTLKFFDAENAHLSRTPKTSFCFQEPRLLPWATVRENIELPGRLSGEMRDGRVETLLDWVDLKPIHQSFRPSELSGGMQMRVGMARALYHEPELLLLDEPFAALDELTRGVLDDVLLRLVKARSMSALMVTHSVSEALYLADEIWIFTAHPGRLLQVYRPPFADRTSKLRTSKAFGDALGEVHTMLAQSMTGTTK